MREIQYKSFSLKTHIKSWRINKPSVCQFELTFKCDLHCKYCYCDCYNKAPYTERELGTEEVKRILNKVRKEGVIWLCLTGGDPLTRPDFLDIYSYARDKGFIVTIFTNACSMTEETAKYFKKSTPFVIEITLNAVTKETYEEMSQVEGSFERAMEGISLILKFKLPLKIKTKITKDNSSQMPKIKEFIEGTGLRFRPNYELHARLNGSLTPCALRIAPEEIFGVDKKKPSLDGFGSQLSSCGYLKRPEIGLRKPAADLFQCAADSGDGIEIDPYGNVFLCPFIREPVFNLLKVDIDYARNKLLPLVRNRKFITDSRCNGCNLREGCYWCPGKAYLEKGNLEQPIDYYCESAHLAAGRKK